MDFIIDQSSKGFFEIGLLLLLLLLLLIKKLLPVSKAVGTAFVAFMLLDTVCVDVVTGITGIVDVDVIACHGSEDQGSFCWGSGGGIVRPRRSSIVLLLDPLVV